MGALCHAKGSLCWHWVTGQGLAPEERKEAGRKARLCRLELEEDGC